MRFIRVVSPVIVAIFAAACGDAPAAPSVDDSEDAALQAAFTLDVASTAGNALAVLVFNLTDTEDWAEPGATTPNVTSSSATIGRTQQCYDATGARVNNCTPFASVRMIATSGFMNGERSVDPVSATAAGWAGRMHRTMVDTTRRIFAGGTETARIHTAVEVGNDTTNFLQGTVTRKLAETVLDSVNAVTFSMPRAVPVRPVSGSIVRRVTATVEMVHDGSTVKHSLTRRIEVIFPADAQGVVALKIDGKTCQMTLPKGVVTGCQ